MVYGNWKMEQHVEHEWNERTSSQRMVLVFFAKVSFLRRKTNNTQAPGLDTPRCVTLGGLYTAAERIQPAEQEQRPGPGGGVGLWCPGEDFFNGKL